MADGFLTEDIVIEILLRLPSGLCIARFRCVCRSWRNLLYDPNFLGRILAFKNPNDEETLRILITGISRGESSSSYTFHYSSRSYETLAPISGSSSHDSPAPFPPINGERLSIVGCCDGIFCILDAAKSGVSQIFLLNPAISETKTLPPCRGCDRDPFNMHVTSFGFDPWTEDYKVVRVLRFKYYGRLDFSAEVYSLRNDRWKTLSIGSYDEDYIFGPYFSKRIYVSQQRDTSRNEKCYWFCNGSSASTFDLTSFDMTTEEFALTKVARPRGLEHWSAVSCFVSKGVFMATFMRRNYKGEGPVPCEIWGLLKSGVAVSWTKLLTVRPPGGEGLCRCLEVWKDGMYIGADGRWMDGTHRMFGFDPAAGEIIDDHLEIEGTIRRFHAHTYLPTQVSLSRAAN